MIGAIAGDVIGSTYEALGEKRYDFPLFTKYSRFTDDTVLTIAVARAILENRDYGEMLQEVGRQYPLAGYGQSFSEWLFSPEIGAYNSWGNGAAMRVSPIGFAGESIEQVLEEAKKSAEVTHNHPEGIKGAQATALSIYLARKGNSKAKIREVIAERFEYDLDRSVEDMRPGYSFDISCQGSVPESIICFLDSNDLEGTIRNAVSMGGDADTMACIAGGVAQAFYKKIPEIIIRETKKRLPEEFLIVIDKFSREFGIDPIY
ncbi:MAG: ADP-ribosylglycohydrolase family protein [Gammaproteobacteria bacterium]|nr:ADP-ribosylglycohydrolase family protein [Gammaproteobacteria bacterium]